MAKRTEYRTKTGKKMYAVRKSNGRFSDVQTYKRAHTLDIKKRSKAELGIE